MKYRTSFTMKVCFNFEMPRDGKLLNTRANVYSNGHHAIVSIRNNSEFLFEKGER